MTKPLLVGITGGIGAGKSMVCQVFQHLGVPVYDADTRARWLMLNQSDLIRDIKETFGAESYMEDGSLNRAYLSGRVFGDEKELLKLNELVHPKVGEDFTNWVATNNRAPYLIKEAALLIESGSYKELDKLVVVLAKKEVRVDRVLLRDHHRSKVDVLAIIEKQLTDEAFKSHADHVINNNGDTLILPKVLKLHDKFKALARQ